MIAHDHDCLGKIGGRVGKVARWSGMVHEDNELSDSSVWRGGCDDRREDEGPAA